MNAPKALSSLLQRIRSTDVSAILLKGAILAFLIKVVGTGLSYFYYVFLARWLGVAEYGNYTFAFSWAELLSSFAGLGLGTGVLRFAPQYYAQRDWGKLLGLVSRSQQLTFGVGVAIAVCVTSLVFVLQPQHISIISLILGIFLTPFLALQKLQTSLIQSTKKIFWAYAPPTILQPLIIIGLVILLSRLLGSLTSTLALSALAISIFIVCVVQFVRLKSLLPPKNATLKPIFETKQWLRVSFPLWLIAGFQIVLNRSDNLMIGVLVGSREVGIYSAASKTAWLISFVLAAVNAIAAPMISSYYSQRDHQGLQNTVTTATRLIFFPSLVITIVILVFSPVILSIFGKEFVEGKWVLVILAFGQLANASAGPVGYLMGLTGHERLSCRVYGYSVLANIVLNFTLIPMLGIAGVAIATSSTMALWNIWLFILVKQKVGIHSFVLGGKSN